MDMGFLFASLIDGLLLGFVFGVAAIGLTLIFGVMEVINLAHGPVIALGMFGLYFAVTLLGLHPYAGTLLTAVGGLFLGILIYAIAVHRVIGAPHLSSLLATYSINMMIIGIGTALLTTSPRNIEFSLGSVTLGTATIPVTRIVAALASLLAAVALYLFMQYTRWGKFIRAVTDNRDAAELVGIPSTKVLALSFGLGTMLAAFSGALIATLFPFTILEGGKYELKSFVISVLGGLGNPMGALIGGIIIGLIEGLVPVFLPTTWVLVVEFVLFVLILLIRPTGLFGGRAQ